MAFDNLCAVALVLGWLTLAFSDRVRLGSTLVLVSGLSLIALNQHRLQPWHYQLLIFAGLFLVRDGRQQLGRMRWVVISVYFYSALSKIDFLFAHSVGAELTSQLLGFLPGDWQLRPPQIYYVAGLMPVAELILAAGLLFQRTRWAAAIGVIGLHLSLIAALGPWGLDHSLGVLFWNLHFIGLVCLLFVGREIRAEQTAADTMESEMRAGEKTRTRPSKSSAGGGSWATWLVVPFLALPLLERWGYWDHWLSWAVYAPHSSRVDVRVATTAVDRLPLDLQRLVNAQIQTPPAPQEMTGESAAEDLFGLWVDLPIDQWSLSSLGVPIYPQARFQLGVARYLATGLDSEFEIRVSVRGVASRFSGHRQSENAEGKTQIQQLSTDFWLNTRPREADDSIVDWNDRANHDRGTPWTR